MFNNLTIASKIFKRHRSRTILSVLGITIGITSVIAIINAGESLNSFIMDQVEVFGTDYIEVEVKVPNTAHASSENAGAMASGIEITTLKIEDAEEMEKHPNISRVYSGVLGQEIVSYQGTNKVGLLWGVTEGFFEIDKNEIEKGRPFTEDEDKSLAQVVILGYEIAEDLFGNDDPIGKKISINKRKYKVIGVRENIGTGTFLDFDDMIIMPLRTLQKKLLGINHVSFIMGSVVDMDNADQSVDEITAIIREEHEITDPNKDDFAVISSSEAMEMMDTIMNGLTIFLVAIASISLIVGGVGVMNIMYVSVLERTYEIGLRKSVGAKSADIMKQFLAEAILITSLGGVIGVIFGVLITLAISIVAASQGFAIAFVVSIPGILISVIFMILTGIIFGFYPAKSASSLDPVEALRYE
jgi:putative ABC transport system permease protein